MPGTLVDDGSKHALVCPLSHWPLGTEHAPGPKLLRQRGRPRRIRALGWDLCQTDTIKPQGVCARICRASLASSQWQGQGARCDAYTAPGPLLCTGRCTKVCVLAPQALRLV